MLAGVEEPLPGVGFLEFRFAIVRYVDGLAVVSLEAPDHSRLVPIWMDHTYGYVMALGGDSLPEAGGCRRALGVEPMSAALNAFQSCDGMRTLQPDEAFSTPWGIIVPTEVPHNGFQANSGHEASTQAGCGSSRRGRGAKKIRWPGGVGEPQRCPRGRRPQEPHAVT
ncbi:MAG: hypothetical protein M3082_12130 [Candidatus Dormibacteraeota bacterium]|nr:hypothetical protein [Candidatus Dormibacteraeota bacterium]